VFEMFVLVLTMINDHKQEMIKVVHQEEMHLIEIINIYYNQLKLIHYDEI
jgi:hypothetical protein